jgi:pimeloyl-ACP methyl ester carboxylesterase
VAIASAAASAQITTMAPFEKLPPYGNNTLPAGVKPRLVPNVNGLTVNMLEAGTQGRPLVLLLHGFPNLAYSWRKVMPAIADAGYYVVAPDCRGYGRTVGWDRSWDADPTPFLTLNMVRDQIALVYALGYRKAELIVGHDQGQLMATYAAIVRPDMFLRLTTVSGQGAAPPSFPFAGTERNLRTPLRNSTRSSRSSIRRAATIRSTGRAKQADEDMKHMPQSMSDFFRAFYYMKGGEFPGNQN